MKKKIITLGFTLVMVLSLTSCGSSFNNKSEIYGIKKTEISTQMEGIGKEINSLSTNDIDKYADKFKEAYETATDDNSKNQAKIYKALFDGYNDSRSSLGDFKKFGDLTIEKSGKTVTCTLYEDFSKRDANLVFVYNIVGERMNLSAINVNPIYSMGETMSKAGLNVVMGMSVVFIVLILISLIIYAFRIIPYFEKKKKEHENLSGSTIIDDDLYSDNNTEDMTINSEIAAVIIAAIKASGEEKTDDFVVRSIKRR